MKISYNWLKWYIPEVPQPDKLRDVFTYHICEVESVEKIGTESKEDTIFDINILPNRAHDLLSHQGIARELASLLNIKFNDPKLMYKIPESKPTKLVKRIESEKCRRYMGRIVRNVKIGPSPDWVVDHLSSIGQRSINNIVDATNIVTFDCGQPAHVFDLNKIKDLKLQVRNAKKGEKITILGGIEKTLDDTMMIIADDYGHPLDIAGIKGGEYAELTKDTTDIILECANFDSASVRKTAQVLNIFTDAKKRFENELSPELTSYGMLELSALIFEMCPEAIFEDIVDIYPKKQEERRLSFSSQKISSILGTEVSNDDIEVILKRYNFAYTEDKGIFNIVIPPMRLDLTIEEDMAEEIGRILGYDKVKEKMPKINFKPKANDFYEKISWARNKLLNDGYGEVMTYAFRDKGEVEVLASASDKKFLRTNLKDGLAESLKLNQLNLPLLDIDETTHPNEGIKIFEIGAVFKKDKEQTNVCYGDKKNIIEISLEDFCKDMPSDFSLEPRTYDLETSFKMWSMFPFIVRDIALWVPEDVKSVDVEKVIRENMSSLVMKGPRLFDEFKKDGKKSYAFRLIFQSHERTLKDEEVNEIMAKITNKISENRNWQIR